MMSISNPRECTQSADHDRKVSHYPHNKNCIMLQLMGAESVDDFQKQP